MSLRGAAERCVKLLHYYCEFTTKNVNFDDWLKICTFTGRMKKFLMNISAALLVVWYCMSIIGFGVHTCASSGEVFIASFADGVECADIHPEHHCCGESCCSGTHHDDHETPSCCSSKHHVPIDEHHEPTSVDTKSCCSNEYQAIVLSGCRTDNGSDEKHSFSKVFFPCVIDIPVSYIASAKYHAEHIQFWEHDSGVLLPGDLCVTYGVWRI